ncbi:putative ABC transporter ATP-binding protein [mine drainage metagenome]|uniref:Putative ABC transporter ATP-binding protein n=1 Tax=mine drainage metagenome TaxID=410659 RepID=A0A1J5QA64_9ZZZZ
MIQAQDLTAGYDSHTVFRGLRLQIAPGEAVALLGPNGCGKTTLLKTLCGIHAPDSGHVQVDGTDLATLPSPVRARRIAYVPQQHHLVFAFSVFDVVMMGRLAGFGLIARPSREDALAVHATLEQVGLDGLARRPYSALSGGQRQFVLIARALAQDAPYLLLDEPASSLDYGNQLRLLDLLAQLRDQGRGVLFTTHHPDHAFVVATRVLLMRAGRLIDDGPPAQCIHRDRIAELYALEGRQLGHAERAGAWLRGRTEFERPDTAYTLPHAPICPGLAGAQ